MARRVTLAAARWLCASGLAAALGLGLAALGACSLQERSDFLIGRACSPSDVTTCDEGEVCLPHLVVNDHYDDYRCRDLASFEPIEGREPPLAYCDDAQIRCPQGMICNADRVRLDASLRRLVCKLPGDVFSPPDGGR